MREASQARYRDEGIVSPGAQAEVPQLPTALLQASVQGPDGNGNEIRGTTIIIQEKLRIS